MYQRHHLVTFRGHFGTATTERETWSFGLRFKPGATGTEGQLGDLDESQLNGLRQAGEVLFLTSGTMISNAAFFDEIRHYTIGIDGKAEGEVQIARMGTPVPGQVGTPRPPWQNALAVTLDSGYPAKGRFGRFYLPCPAVTVDNTGLIDLVQAQGIQTAVTTFLDSVSNFPGLDIGWGLAVAGQTGQGTLREVQEVRVGRVVDTQRRRRRQVDEAYLSAAFAA